MADKKTKDFRFNLYKVDQIKAATTKVAKDAKSVRDRLHSLLASTVYHWFSGNMKPEDVAGAINVLVEASPYHRKAVAKWVAEMTPLQWSDETKKFFAHEGQKIKESVFLKARDVPFWEVSPPPQAKPMDIWEEIDRLIKKAEHHVEKPVEDDVIDMKAVKALRDVRKLRAAS